jgi:signal recognition particle subunit SRP54
VEAIILSMTPQERAMPHVIDGKRRVRIANGSGTTVTQVNQLLEARKQMAKMMKGMSKGKMPDLPGLTTGANGAGTAHARATPKKSKKKKRSKSRR